MPYSPDHVHEARAVTPSMNFQAHVAGAVGVGAASADIHHGDAVLVHQADYVVAQARRLLLQQLIAPRLAVGAWQEHEQLAVGFLGRSSQT